MPGSEESIICPNCGFHFAKSYNYCPRCGQQSHLHNETFWGLIMHFIGHYFHYDSKFLQTMKALWFSPGKLTIAYWNEQRMRYIPPVSLYIFISAVFFLSFSFVPKSHFDFGHVSFEDSSVASENNFTFHIESEKANRSIGTDIRHLDPNHKINGKTVADIKEHFAHTIPKVFFFMIPFMAFILKLFFLKRKDLFYVNHIIYALHYHSFWFSVALLPVIYPFEAGRQELMLIFLLVAVVYFIISLRKVYVISWLRAIIYSMIIALLYFVFIIVSLSVVLAGVWM
jgi:hypothetical protein